MKDESHTCLVFTLNKQISSVNNSSTMKTKTSSRSRSPHVTTPSYESHHLHRFSRSITPSRAAKSSTTSERTPAALEFLGGKAYIVGMTLSETVEDPIDHLVVYGKKFLKYFRITCDPETLELDYTTRSIKTENVKEKCFHNAIFLENSPKVYVVAGHSGFIYLCSEFQCNLMEKIHESAITGLTCTTDGFATLATNGIWKRFYCDGNSLTSYQEGSLEDFDFIRNFGAARSLCFQKETENFIVGCKNNQCVQIKDENSADIILEGHFDSVSCIDCHPFEQWFISGGFDGFIRKWDIIKKQCLGEFNCEQKITALAFNPASTLIMIGTEKSRIILLDAELKPRKMIDFKIRSDATEINEICWSQSGSFCVFGINSGTVILCSIDETENVLELAQLGYEQHLTSAINNLQFTSDEQFVRATSRDDDTQIFQINSDINSFAPYTQPVEDAKWHGKLLLSGFDVLGAVQAATSITCATKSHDSTLLASGDKNGRIRIHEYPALLAQRHIMREGHQNTMTDICFSFDDKYIISSSADSSILIWNVEKNSVLSTTPECNSPEPIRENKFEN